MLTRRSIAAFAISFALVTTALPAVQNSSSAAHRALPAVQRSSVPDAPERVSLPAVQRVSVPDAPERTA